VYRMPQSISCVSLCVCMTGRVQALLFAVPKLDPVERGSMLLLFFFWWNWDLNAGTLPFEPHFLSILLWLFWR
jgi:hypothetical protein